MQRVGSRAASDFLQTGFLLCEALRERAGLAPDASILDVGCGWGRLALPLARVIDERGRYLGMDVAAGAIEWCRDAISATDPRFRFHHADVRSTLSNPGGRTEPSAAVLLPWEEQFDVVVATSLFTHLLPDGALRYISEAARLCRPGGTLFATYFLMDEEAAALCAVGRSRHRFPARHGVAHLATAEVPEDAVAFPPDFIISALQAAGFDTEVLPGAWCDRAGPAFDYQDVIVGRRRGGVAAAPSAARPLGRIEAVAESQLVGWAWDRAAEAAPTLRVDIDGQTAAELRPDRERRDLPPAGPPPGARCGFTWPIPLRDGRPHHLRVTAAETGLVLFDRAGLVFDDPARELLKAWTRESVAHGLWRIERLERGADGRLNGFGWAVPPGGVPAQSGYGSGHYLAGAALTCGDGVRIELAPVDQVDQDLGAALGLAADQAPRPWFHFHLPPDLAGTTRITLGAPNAAPFDPPRGFLVDPKARGDFLAAADVLCLEAALRRHFGRGLGEFASALDWRGGFGRIGLAAAGRAVRLTPDRRGAEANSPEAVASPPLPSTAGSHDLVLAIDGFEELDEPAEAAWRAELRRVTRPGGAVLAAVSGRAAWLVTPDTSPARFLAWQRHGLAALPARRRSTGGQLPVRTVYTRAHILGVWGLHFEVLELAEAALVGSRDLVVMRRRASVAR